MTLKQEQLFDRWVIAVLLALSGYCLLQIFRAVTLP